MPGCKGVGRAENEEAVYVQCEVCGTQICFKCRQIHHPKKSCGEFYNKQLVGYMRENEDVSDCPSCKTVVLKVEGCNHMTCYVCGYEWCWICGDAYTPEHLSVLNPKGC
mmetsp:Transcript_40246/g.38711  ORF Transcript_40246/g.38711 Transcript_40246/m.38711 type:complete len:109 (-) Transcript_40246:421-747(-)